MSKGGSIFIQSLMGGFWHWREINIVPNQTRSDEKKQQSFYPATRVQFQSKNILSKGLRVCWGWQIVKALNSPSSSYHKFWCFLVLSISLGLLKCLCLPKFSPDCLGLQLKALPPPQGAESQLPSQEPCDVVTKRKFNHHICQTHCLAWPAAWRDQRDLKQCLDCWLRVVKL